MPGMLDIEQRCDELRLVRSGEGRWSILCPTPSWSGILAECRSCPAYKRLEVARRQIRVFGRTFICRNDGAKDFFIQQGKRFLAMLSWLFPHHGSDHALALYDKAMNVSGDLIHEMKESPPDPLREIFHDFWIERTNVPYATTMYEAHQEMIAPLRQGRK